MERDLRITGSFRGQSSNHQAPTGFEVSNPWKVRITDFLSLWLQAPGRNADPRHRSRIGSTSSKMQPLFLYVQCLRLSYPLSYISTAISLETSLYHIICSLGFPSSPLSLLELRGHSPNTLDLTLTEMHIEILGQCLDAVLFGLQHLQDLRLPAQSHLDFFTRHDALTYDLCAAWAQKHSHADKDLGEPACSALAGFEVHDAEILW